MTTKPIDPGPSRTAEAMNASGITHYGSTGNYPWSSSTTHIVRPGSITGDTRIGFTGTAYCGIRVGHVDPRRSPGIAVCRRCDRSANPTPEEQARRARIIARMHAELNAKVATA